MSKGNDRMVHDAVFAVVVTRPPRFPDGRASAAVAGAGGRPTGFGKGPAARQLLLRFEAARRARSAGLFAAQ